MAAPARPVSDASALLQENTRPPAGAGAGAAAVPGPSGKASSNQEACGAARELGTPVDGGGPATRRFGQPAGPSSAGFLGRQASGPASQHPGLGRRRKRPASPAVYVDDEFRDGRVRPMLSRSASDDSTPAASSAATAGSPTSSTAPTALEAPLAPAGPCPDGDGGDASDLEVEGEENARPAARGASPAVDDSRALRDVEIDVPAEYKEDPYDAIDPSEDDDFQSGNLAEHLFERVGRNAGGKYVFDVYIDPSARCAGA